MSSNFSRWIKRVQETRADEIDCSACLDQISQYVDLELSDENAARRMPLVHQHLGQCGVCMDEYQVLQALAYLENQGDLPTNEDLSSQLKRGSN